MSWTKTADGQYYQFTGDILMPVSPETGAAVLLLRPKDGMGANIPAIERGEPGLPAAIDETINFTELDHDDPTPGGASWDPLAPPDPETGTPGLWRLNLALHRGAPGADGSVELDPEDFSVSPVAGQVLAVNAGADGFELVSPRVGGRYIPASVNNTTTGNVNSTLAVVSVPAQPFDWRPRCHGYTVVTGEGSDVRVDFLARLNDENGGNIVARCTGVAATERLTLVPGPPAGSADGFDKVSAGSPAVIYFRCERQSGSLTYTTSSSTTLVSVEVLPI